MIKNTGMTVLSFLEMTGITRHLNTEGVTEIIINKPHEIITESFEGWKFYEEAGATLQNLKLLTQALTTYNNLPDATQKDPVKSLSLPTGERVQIIIPPACGDGYFSLTIRKPSRTRFTLEDYLDSGRFSNVKQAQKTTADITEAQTEMLELYQRALEDEKAYLEFFKKGVENRYNFLVVGGTGSGKTTFAKAIADLFPLDRRIITIEDVPEMDLPNHRNKLHLFYKAGVVKPKFLIESAMRMKPDHIFLAELRGDEAWSYIEALNTGHEGSVTTIHANNTYMSFSRLASIIKQSEIGLTLDYNLVMNTIKSSIDIIMFFNHTKMTEIYFNPIEKNKILAGGYDA